MSEHASAREAFEQHYRTLRAGVRSMVAKAQAAGKLRRTGLGPEDFRDRLERRADGEYEDPNVRIKWHDWLAAWDARVERIEGRTP